MNNNSLSLSYNAPKNKTSLLPSMYGYIPHKDCEHFAKRVGAHQGAPPEPDRAAGTIMPLWSLASLSIL